MSSKKRELSLYGLLIASLAFLALIFALVAGGRDKMVLPLAEPGFTLDGTYYQSGPVVQDLLDGGWTLGDAIEESGRSRDGAVPEELFATGYAIEKGESRVKMYLYDEDCWSGVAVNDCRVRSLVFHEDDVDSFCLGGQDVNGAGQEKLRAVLGEPDLATESEHTRSWRYTLWDDNAFWVSFTLPLAAEGPKEIMAAFE